MGYTRKTGLQFSLNHSYLGKDFDMILDRPLTVSALCTSTHIIKIIFAITVQMTQETEYVVPRVDNYQIFLMKLCLVKTCLYYLQALVLV